MLLLINLPAVVTGTSKSNHHTRYHSTCFCLSQIPMPSKRSEAPRNVVSRSKNTLVYKQYLMGCGHWAWIGLAKHAENAFTHSGGLFPTCPYTGNYINNVEVSTP